MATNRRQEPWAIGRVGPLLPVAVVATAFAIAGCGPSSPGDDPSLEGTADSTSRTSYQCEGGTTIHAAYPTDSTALVEYDGQTLRMIIAVSASGARYVGGGWEWWTKGSEPGADGTLFRHDPEGTTGEAVESCELDATPPPTRS